MHPSDLGGSPVLPYGAPRSMHTRTSTAAFLATISAFGYTSDANQVNGLGWKLLDASGRTLGSPTQQDLLSPLVYVAQDVNGAAEAQDVDLWTNSPLFQTHPTSSPRQRYGFSRGPLVLSDASPHSSLPSETGCLSPSLPTISPHAPAVAKRAIRRHKTTSFTGLYLVNPQMFWVALYFAFNLVLTLYNKGVLVRFPFPYSLTALHAFCGSIGGYVLMRRGAYTPAPLNVKDHIALAAFSVLYAVNIAVSNVSLNLVTVPFHQVVRAITPIFTTFLSMLLFRTQFSQRKFITLIPVIFGVALATYGDYYFSTWGLLLTLTGTFLAALKTIFTNVIQSPPSLPSRPSSMTPPFSLADLILPPRLDLHPLDLLTRMSPFACIQCMVYAYATGEFERMWQPNDASDVAVSNFGLGRVAILLGNGLIAFGLNIVSLSANRKVGALNMTVAANVKQVLTILFAVVIFDLTITTTNAVGILVTLGGGAWYAYVEYLDKAQKSRTREPKAARASVVL